MELESFDGLDGHRGAGKLPGPHHLVAVAPGDQRGDRRDDHAGSEEDREADGERIARGAAGPIGRG